MTNKHDEKDCIHGITCMVDSCHYHSPKNHCTAHDIKINGSHADDKTDTLCQTFEKE